MLKEEFVDIYSKSTVKLSKSKVTGPNTKLLDIEHLADLLQNGKEGEVVIVKMDIGNYTNGQVVQL